MSEPTSDRPVKNLQEEIVRKRSLAAALAEVKNRRADRDDVVVDLKEAERVRLELLGEEIKPLFDDLPDDNEQFEFALTNGRPPRLWIDMTAHVVMGHDRRIYRFLKDTRAGRIVLAESHDMKVVGDAVGNYVAGQVLERERILDGEWESIRLVEETARHEKRQKSRAAWHGLFWFLFGFGLSIAGLYIWLRYGDVLLPLLKPYI